MTKQSQFFVYLMTNPTNTVIYTGVTNDLLRRVFEHKEKLHEGFSKRYNIVKLVYYETFIDSYSAISREKQIKAGSRKKKIALIEPMNPNWKDLYDELVKGEKQSFLFLTSPKMSLRAERSNLFHGKDCFVGVASSQ